MIAACAALALSLAANVLTLKRALKLHATLTAGGLAVERCLDNIDASYAVVGRILQGPLASNDPRVVQIHKELKATHGNLLVIADRLASSWGDDAQEGGDVERE